VKIITMASNLKWRLGFGWGIVLIATFSVLAALSFSGLIRWLGLAVALTAGVHMVYQYRKWNGRGWRQVHFRAMLAYTGIAGREQRLAREGGREFDLRGACSQLGLLLCGENNQPAVDAMLADLGRQQGSFLAGLVERHSGEVVPGMPAELRRDIAARLRGVRLGPQLVIGAVIENTYGGPEAARYAVAVAVGDAE
jgi:hypothetical protein